MLKGQTVSQMLINVLLSPLVLYIVKYIFKRLAQPTVYIELNETHIYNYNYNCFSSYKYLLLFYILGSLKDYDLGFMAVGQ